MIIHSHVALAVFSEVLLCKPNTCEFPLSSVIYMSSFSPRHGLSLVALHWTCSLISPRAPRQSTQYLSMLFAQTQVIIHQSTDIFLIPCHVVICLPSCQEESTFRWMEERGQILRQLFVTQFFRGGSSFAERARFCQHAVLMKLCWAVSLCVEVESTQGLYVCLIVLCVCVAGCRRASGVSWVGKKQLSHGLEQGE